MREDVRTPLPPADGEPAPVYPSLEDEIKDGDEVLVSRPGGTLFKMYVHKITDKNYVLRPLNDRNKQRPRRRKRRRR